MLQNQLVFEEVNLQRGCDVSGSASSIDKSGIPSWVDAGIWVDVVLIGMVVGSVLGLAYTFLLQ